MSLNSFSETSGNGFLKTSIQHSFIDSKELSLLDNLELTPIHGILSEVLPEENQYFKEDDWKVQDLDHLDDEPAPNPSENIESSERNLLECQRTLKNGSSCSELEKNSLWEEDYDFFQQEGEGLLDMVDTSNSNEEELVSVFSFLKTDGKNHQAVSKKTKTAVGSSGPSCPDRTNSHGASKSFLKKRRQRLRLLEKSSGGLFDELEHDDDSSCKVKGVLFIQQDMDAFVQKSSYRVVGGCHYKKRSRRFPVDRSSLLRSVLTKNVYFSVL